MSDEYDFEDPEFDSEGIRNLRKQVDKLAKQNADLSRQLEEAQRASAKATVDSTLRDLGANPKLARYIPSDIEPSREAIEKWLNEDGELFGFKPKTEEKPEQTSAPAEAPQAAQPQGFNAQAALPAELIEAFNRVQNPESFGGVPAQGLDAQAVLQMKSLAEKAGNSFQAFEELHRQLQ